MSAQDHLNRREARAREQAKLAGLGPVVSFTAVTPGPAKDDAVARRVATWARDAVASLCAERGWAVLASATTDAPTGPEWLLAVAAEASELKRALVGLEQAHPWGRLADLDVVVLHDGLPTPLGRSHLGLPPRACLLCSQDAAACARSARHPLPLLLAERAWIARPCPAPDAPPHLNPTALADLAVRALIVEAELTPKPGLVDAANPGAHADMDLPLLLRSAQALRPWLRACYQAGVERPGDPSPLVALGVDAERAMLAATDGVNTHRGALFSLGLALGALGAGTRDAASLRAGVAALARPLLEDWLARPTASHGTLAHQRTGALGARGEAASGFATVFDTGLPALLRRLALFGDEDDALRWALVALIAEHDDTNLIARGGVEGLRDAQAWASGVLRSRPDEAALAAELQDADRWFTARRLSPGGSADLLALTWFCWRVLHEPAPMP